MSILCNECQGYVPLERNGNCASCNSFIRKAAKKKAPKPAKKPAKVSDKKRNELDQYTILREAFLLRKWCFVHGKPCLPTQVHHQKGRVGFADEQMREKGISLLLDVRYWIPVCEKAHADITENSDWAIEQGYSFKRTDFAVFSRKPENKPCF
jgi:hypothetical protein